METLEQSSSIITRYVPPTVHTGHNPPAIPSGLKMATDPIGIPYPVMQWGGYTYWPLSYIDNRISLCVVAYDDSGRAVQQWNLDGVRYIHSITLDNSNQLAVFTGQDSHRATVPWKTLIVSPQVHTISNPQPPAIPAGLKLATDPIGAPYPVLQWGGYTYWPFSYIDNRIALCLVAFDTSGALAQQWNLDGVRYISGIAINNQDQTATFAGQGNAKNTVSWRSLMVSPKVQLLDAHLVPPIPPGTKLATNQQGVPYPVLTWGNYRFWPLSYIDNRVAMDIVGYDQKGSIVYNSSQNGARYIDHILVDSTTRTVSFVGQANQRIVMSWDALDIVFMV